MEPTGIKETTHGKPFNGGSWLCRGRVCIGRASGTSGTSRAWQHQTATDNAGQENRKEGREDVYSDGEATKDFAKVTSRTYGHCKGWGLSLIHI